MKLNKNSWHYKVWRDTFRSYDGAPDNTDLCRYCHRIFWRLLLWAFLLFGTLGCLVALIVLLIQGLIYHTAAVIISIMIVVGFIITLAFYDRWLNGKKEPAEPRTLIGKYARASKQKVCPLVEFEDLIP